MIDIKGKYMLKCMRGVFYVLLLSGIFVAASIFLLLPVAANDKSEMFARYERAQHLYLAMNTTKVARNSTVFPVWIGNSNKFWYERELLEGKEYRLVNAQNASNEVAFDHQALAKELTKVTKEKVDASNLPIKKVKIELKPLRVSFEAFNKNWLFQDKTAALTEITVHPVSWVLSPDGKQAVFTRNYNLWVRNIENGNERALTTDGEEFYDYAARTTLWGTLRTPKGKGVQARWSPDGKSIFTLQKDRRKVKTLPVVQHVPLDGSIRPKVENLKIAYQGDENVAEYRLLAIDVETGHVQDAKYGRVQNIQDSNTGFFDERMGWWSKDSRLAYFVDMDRYHQRVRVVEFDMYTGVTRVLFEETSDTHIALAPNENMVPVFVPLPETHEILWYSERSGWAHFYLYDLKTGKLKNTITSGNWRVRDLVYFDAERREVFLQTSGRTTGRNPYYRDLVRVNIDTGNLVPLVASDHEYIAIVQQSSTAVYGAVRDMKLSNGISPTGDYAVVTRSRVDQVPVSFLVDRDGRKILDLEVANLTLPKGWQWPEPVMMKAADGKTDIYGVIYRPSDFDPNKSYPVVDSALLYNPVSSWVAKGSFTNSGFYGFNYYAEAALAELGFIVVQMDGRGIAYRSKSFHDVGYGLFEAGNNLSDHVAGIKQLAERYPYMDIDKVGIASIHAGTGAVMGLLHYPDFYKVGAGAQAYDSRLMVSLVPDKYEGPHGRDPNQKYLEDLAGNLKGKLLMFVAMLNYSDSPPASTLRIVEALQRANKDFDLVVEPKVTRGFSFYQIRRAWDHLVRHLQGVEPPKEFNLGDENVF
ncbi:S9 family peptidase [Paremcibacter congregatus]|uniref:S9 family peptidase n=1 Tax=Paremcibacter congregatus TaxID=2043170 RepID=A0A2G4YQZ4_9PROT|nr:DPP IV N-terminal domain-containing protein [Paremcibacter congregatus]PHZ84739.1 hypothetical protein CRD36_10665 [Paremcibacter congregatus]QDE28932.1 hypothetical protein FIV45_17430 [Paremcibacter congregatus]